MYQFIKMLRYHILLIFCIQNAWGANYKFYSYNNDDEFDITTIYRIKNISSFENNANVGFMDPDFLTTYNENYTIEVHSRTNAVGMPIQINNRVMNTKTLFNGKSFQNCESTEALMWRNSFGINVDGNDCGADNETEEKAVGCFNIKEYLQRYQNVYLKKILTLTWVPEKENSSLSITYRFKPISDYYENTITLKITDSNFETLISSVELEKGIDIKTIKLTDMAFIKDQNYSLSFDFALDYHIREYNEYNEAPFGIIQIIEYFEYDEEVTQIVSLEDAVGLKYPQPFDVLGKNNKEYHANQIKTDTCWNGGYKLEYKTNCICPPGFKGKFCQTACGLNSYGNDCGGICSINSDRICRGILMCTAYGCECPTGLTGPLCNEDCAPGTYGAGCKQNCSSNCYDNKCDKYTGLCSHGCLPGYVFPHCVKRYSYVMRSPELISSQYESLELKLNFNPENINGTSKMIKYYQLLYKTLDEEQYRTSELTVLLNDTITTAIISNLEPGTTYKVGVLIVTDDGNFNDKDIVYGQYNTSCSQPEISEYNMKLVSGVRSINITWNKVQTQRLECDVTEYVLTLTSIKGEQLEILSSSDKGHFINNLIPGIEYKIQLTPKTNKGPLISSPFYSFSPLMTENDVNISNVSTEISNGKIKVFWKFTNTFINDAEIYNAPITCIVKYKVSRVFSCSLKEIENDWTTITVFNRTSYEIFNAVPNAQYIIKLSVSVNDVDTIQSENIVYALTPLASPTTEPILDTEHPMYITNNSVFVQWKIDPMTCSKLNGIFSKFYIELLDKSDNILQVKETNQNFITFNDLKSNSAYEMKIFIKTQFGYNPEKFLIVNFKTKYEYLKPIDDIMVYKKSLKERMVGLRWSYLEGSNVDGFIVSFNNCASSNTSNSFVIQPKKCSAWPEYYCHTFYNLTYSRTYALKIAPKSVDYPEGGDVSSIYFNNNDGLPDSPNNIKTTEIGSNTIQLQWDIPWLFNGALKTFIINIEEISSVDMDTCCAPIIVVEIPIYEEFPTYNYTIMDLQPGSTYSIGVVSVSKSLWYSSPTRISVTTLLNK